jgi:hypothetical protein
VRSLRKTGGKEPLSLRMRDDGHAPPAYVLAGGTSCYAISSLFKGARGDHQMIQPKHLLIVIAICALIVIFALWRGSRVEDLFLAWGVNAPTWSL